MLIDIVVTLFIVGYVAFAVIGHAMPKEGASISVTQALLCGIITVCALAHGLPAAAETYPTRPIRIIVPFPAGGGVDATARVIAESLSRRLGQSVYIENKSGSAGLIGTEFEVRSPADGYTILFTSDSLTSAPHILKAKFNVLKDLVPVVQLTRQPVVLAVHSSLGVSTLAELIALAKQNPGMSYATSGLASPQSITPLWLARIAGIKLEPVPYRGGGPAVNDLIAGHVKIGSIGVAPLIPHYKAGTVRFLAQTSETRSPSLPEVPTYRESGIGDLVLEQWFGVFAPAATPAAIVERLNLEIGKVLVEPAVRATLQQTAQEPVGGSAEQFARLVRADYDKYRRLVADLNIRAQ